MTTENADNATNTTGSATATASTGTAASAAVDNKATEQKTNDTATQTGDTAKAGAEAKPDGDGKTNPSDANGKDQKVVPEKYEDFTMVEGVAANEETMSEFSALAKEAGLDQATAQKFVTLGAKMSKGIADKNNAALEAMHTDWVNQSKSDKEFGGDKLEENLGVAKRGMDAYASPSLVKLLGESKLGNHPEVIRLFFKIGKTVSEDTHVNSAKSASTLKSNAEVFFGKSGN